MPLLYSRTFNMCYDYVIPMPRVNTGLKEKDFQDGKLVRTDIDGKSIVIGMTSGKLYAMDSVCSHEGGPLEDGSLDGFNLTCPWHHGIFDIAMLRHRLKQVGLQI